MDKFIIIGVILFVSALLLVGYDNETQSFFIDVNFIPKFLCEIPSFILNDLTESDLEDTNFAGSLKDRYGCE